MAPVITVVPANVLRSQRKFREALKKDGLQLSAGKIVPLDDAAKAGKAAATLSKRKPKAEVSEATPKKKPRKAKKEAAEEEAASEEQEEDNGESS